MCKTLFIAFFFIFQVYTVQSQTTVDKITKQKVKQIVDYHYFILNTLGDSDAPDQEKEIIINQTCLKSFLSTKVQIEDDLDITRTVVTNKDVQAYLKDVDFFFNNAIFKYRIENISIISKNRQIVYKIEVERHLKATTIKGEVIDNKINRFFEINKQIDSNELKIASIYTQKISLDEEYSIWWENLSEVWKSVIRKKCNFYEKPKKNDFENIASIDSLDISNSFLIEDLQPLLKLYQLEYLDISNTSLVDVTDLKYCSKLKYFKASNTNVENYNSIKFSSSITNLDISNNDLDDFNFLLGLKNLEQLNLSHSNIIKVSPKLKVLNNCDNLKILLLNGVNLRHIGKQIPLLNKLEVLSVNNNDLKDLEGIDIFKNLKELDFSGNLIVSINGISKNSELEIIKANNTYINDFQEVEKLTMLKELEFNVDHNNEKIVSSLANKKPKIKILYNNIYLKKWWSSLTLNQENFFIKNFQFPKHPNINDLIKIKNIKKLDLSHLKWVNDISFIEPLVNLKTLDISHTLVKDMSVLGSLKNLTSIKMSGITVDSFDELIGLEKLESIDISNGEINSTSALLIPTGVTKININETIIKKNILKKTMRKYPKILWIYENENLKIWWKNLQPIWQEIFSTLIHKKENIQLSGDELHRIRLIEKLEIRNNKINDLTPCIMLVNLKYLDISALKINSLSPIEELKFIEHLNVSQNPITSLQPIKNYKNLKALNIANTAIVSLDDIKTIFSLEKIDLSGTSIKELQKLELLAKLIEINLSNTPIKTLKDVIYLPKIKTVICYNSKVKQKSIDQFKERHSNAKVIYE